MIRSSSLRFVRSLAFAVAAFEVVVLVACGPIGPVRRSFSPGEYALERDGVRVEIAAAEYEPEFLGLQVVVQNRNAAAIVIEPEGILLHQDDLEFPLTPDVLAGKRRLELGPGERLSAKLRFRLGHALLPGSTLILRLIHRGEQTIDPIAMAVPIARSPDKRERGRQDERGSTVP